MNKYKSILLISLCLILVFGSIGCSTDKNNTPAKETQKTDTSSKDNSKSNSKDATTKTADNDNATNYEIKIGLWSSADFGNDEIAQYLNDKFNISLKFEDFSWADYLEKLNVSASSGTFPDMFAHPNYSALDTRATFMSWAEQEVIKPLPEDLSKYPQLAKMMDNYDFLRLRSGKHFVIPRIAWQPENAFVSQALWVRKDWMENVGITKIPENMDELYDLLKAFTFNDPDKNGADDTYGLTKSGVTWIYNAFQIEALNWIKEDGQYIPSQLSKRNIDVIKFLKKLYDDGILDPDYATLKGDQGTDKFISGKAGCIGLAAEAYHFKQVLVDKMKKINSEWGPEVVDIIGPLKSQYGDPITNNFDNYWSGTLFSATLNDEKMDRCLQLYDYLLSDEGLELSRFGLEGQHFERDGDKYKSKLPVDPDTNLPKAIAMIAPTANIKTLVTWDVDGRWLEPSMPQECVELEKKAKSLIDKYERVIDPQTRYISTPAVDALQISAEYDEMLYTGIMASDDVEAHFNAFLEDILKNKGGQKAIDEYNQQIKELGIK